MTAVVFILAVFPLRRFEDSRLLGTKVPIQLGWPFPMLKYKYIGSNFIKQHSLWFEITKTLIAV